MFDFKIIQWRTLSPKGSAFESGRPNNQDVFGGKSFSQDGSDFFQTPVDVTIVITVCQHQLGKILNWKKNQIKIDDKIRLKAII